MSDRVRQATDRPGDRARQGADRQGGSRLVSVGDAAAALGISPDSVRGRIRRGTLPATKVDGAWRVDLSGEPAATAGDTLSRQGDRQGADRRPTGPDQPAVDPAYVEHLEREIAYLREQLAESIATNRRHAEGDAGRGIAAGVAVLEVGPVAGAGTDLSNFDKSARPWWRRWFGGR